MSRPVRGAALQAVDFLAAVRNEVMNDYDESDEYSEDNDNMNQNNTESEEDLPEKEVEIATQDPDDTSEDEIAVPLADSTQQTNKEFLSTNGSQRWNKVPINPDTGRMRLQNVLNQSPGPISAVVQRSDSVLGTFSCFITTEMLTKVAHYTNEEGQTQIPNSWVDVSVDKLRKYLGLRLLAGIYSASKEAITHLWNKETGRPIFGNTMARNRFSAITRCLRFDSKIDRPPRRAQDKLAPIRVFCNQIFSKFRGNFRPSENLCVDEQLVLFRGRCAFRVYIPSNPGKYGIKIWVPADVASFTNQNYHKGKLSRRRLFLEELAFQLIGKDTHDAPDTSNPPSTSTSNRRKKRRCLDCP